MSREVDWFRRFKGLSEAQLNWRPAAADTNSLCAIVTHVLGNAEENVLQTACYCRVANLTPPGQPCYCLTAAGARVDGYVLAYRFTDVPSVVK